MVGGSFGSHQQSRVAVSAGDFGPVFSVDRPTRVKGSQRQRDTSRERRIQPHHRFGMGDKLEVLDFASVDSDRLLLSR